MTPPDPEKRERRPGQGAALEVKAHQPDYCNSAAAVGKAARLARIAELIEMRGGDFWAGQARRDELHALRRECAADFGAARGWNLSARGFGPMTLAGRRLVYRAPYREWHFPHPFGDHRDHFRHNRRAAGVVGHLYALPDDHEVWAAANNLRAEILAGSWWFPGRTIAVLYTPLPKSTTDCFDEAMR